MENIVESRESIWRTSIESRRKSIWRIKCYPQMIKMTFEEECGKH